MDLLSRIRHRRTRALLSSYIDGEVSADDARRVEEHAAACSECRDEIESLRATVELVRALPELELPRSFELTRLPDTEPRAGFGVWAPRLATSVAGLLLVALLAADFAGTLVQSGGFDEESMEMQFDAPPPAAPAAIARAPEAPAPQQPQAAAAPPMAAQAAPTQAVEPMSANAKAATTEASEAAPAPAAAAMAQKSGPETAAETPPPAEKARTEAAADATGRAGPPGQPGEPASADMQAQEQAEAQAAPASTPVPGDAIPTDAWEPSDDEDDFGVSLRQLQVAAAVCFAALAGITVWLGRRRRV